MMISVIEMMVYVHSVPYHDANYEEPSNVNTYSYLVLYQCSSLGDGVA